MEKRNRTKNKRILLILLAAAVAAVILIVCLVYHHNQRKQPGAVLTAVICEVYPDGGSYLVSPTLGSDELRSSDLITVPIKNVDSPRELKAGDLVIVEYSGDILESYPASLSDVTKITYAGSVAENESEMERFVIYEDRLYLKNRLSDELIGQLEQYAQLTEEEKAASDYYPEELNEQIGYTPIPER